MTIPATDIRTLNRRAVRYSVEIVEQVGPEDLGRPTPCAGWTLADLLAHMTVQHRGFAAAADGNGGDLTNWKVQPAGEDAVAQYRVAADGVIAAFGAPGVLDRDFVLPEFGDPAAPPSFPAARAIGFHFIDYVVHGWDVARTLDVPFEPAPELLEPALDIALAVPNGNKRLRDGASFRPALEVSGDGLGMLERMLAHLGRSPRWPEGAEI